MSSTARDLLALLEAMDVATALETLGLTKADLGNKDKIKKAYREKALSAHPDRGGSEETMKLVNQAYELLQGSAGRASPDDSFAKWKADNEIRKTKDTEIMKVMAVELDKTIKLDVFKDHIEKATGKSFKGTIHKETKQDVYGSTSWLTYRMNLVSDDGATTFDMNVDARPGASHGGALGGSGAEHVSFPVSISTSVLHDNRKVKLAAKNWVFTDNHKTLVDPEELFPTAKLKKMVAGKEKGRAFQRRDMMLSLEKRLGSHVWGGKDASVTMPMGDLWLLIFRHTFAGTAGWGVNGLYQAKTGGKRVSMLATTTFPESEASIEFLVTLQKGAAGKTGEALITYLNHELNAHAQKLRASPAQEAMEAMAEADNAKDTLYHDLMSLKTRVHDKEKVIRHLQDMMATAKDKSDLQARIQDRKKELEDLKKRLTTTQTKAQQAKIIH